MAIPLIVGLGLAAVGAYKGGKALIDNSKAEDVNSSAQDIVRKSEAELNNARAECQRTLQELGAKKADTIEHSVQNFLQVFSQIKNVDFEHDGDLGNLQLREAGLAALAELKEHVSFVLTSGLGAGGGALGGALTAYGAYSGVMAFGAASTGTAISTLSGAAATNATLAWLGGGSIAAGGGGVAAGTLALGALAAGPALLVAGWYMRSKAESKLNNARSNLAEAHKFEEEAKAAVALTDGICKVAQKAIDILSGLRKHSRRNLNALKTVISEHGTDYAQYGREAKMVVLKNVKIMQVIKTVIDTPILDEQGNLLGDAANNLSAIQQNIDNDFQGALPA